MVIPAFVEVTDEGYIAPSTMPNWLSIIIALGGAALIVKPTYHRTQSFKSFAITGAYVAVLVIGVFAMSYLGFVYVGPVLGFGYYADDRRKTSSMALHGNRHHACIHMVFCRAPASSRATIMRSDRG